MQSIGKKAKDSAFKLKNISTTLKNGVIIQMANNIENEMKSIIEANKIDLENAVKNNVEKVKINRLALNEAKIKAIIKGLKDIALLPDTINEVISTQRRPNGMDGREENSAKDWLSDEGMRRTVPKVLWIKKNKPKIFKKVSKIAFTDTYIYNRLCNITACDPTDGVMGILNYNTLKWDDKKSLSKMKCRV
ncbi:unnamed protein product [marine sediment metagenome]|uniref:Carbohydrate kinase FGGY N-terminal domain-containing protein n=1 Tax=marine sediment metagenome TaxID=412755 RepID=X1ALH9_9ZZZZ